MIENDNTTKSVNNEISQEETHNQQDEHVQDNKDELDHQIFENLIDKMLQKYNDDIKEVDRDINNNYIIEHNENHIPSESVNEIKKVMKCDQELFIDNKSSDDLINQIVEIKTTVYDEPDEHVNDIKPIKSLKIKKLRNLRRNLFYKNKVEPLNNIKSERYLLILF